MKNNLNLDVEECDSNSNSNLDEKLRHFEQVHVILSKTQQQEIGEQLVNKISVPNLNFGEVFEAVASIPIGLTHFSDCIDQETQLDLHAFLNKEFETSNSPTKRLIYGGEASEIPAVLQQLQSQISEKLNLEFDHICCERFGKHTKQLPVQDGLNFSEQVVIVNLLRPGRYVFRHNNFDLDLRKELTLHPRDVVLLSGDMRYNWARGVISPAQLESRHHKLKKGLEKEIRKAENEKNKLIKSKIGECDKNLAKLRRKLENIVAKDGRVRRTKSEKSKSAKSEDDTKTKKPKSTKSKSTKSEDDTKTKKPKSTKTEHQIKYDNLRPRKTICYLEDNPREDDVLDESYVTPEVQEHINIPKVKPVLEKGTNSVQEQIDSLEQERQKLLSSIIIPKDKRAFQVDEDFERISITFRRVEKNRIKRR